MQLNIQRDYGADLFFKQNYPNNRVKFSEKSNIDNTDSSEIKEKKHDIGKKAFIGATTAAGLFFSDLFLAKGKILSGLSNNKISFIKTMSEEIDNVVKLDNYATKGRVEAFFSIPGLHAVWNHRIIHKLHEWKVPVIPRFLANVSRFLTGIEIHPGAQIGKNVFFDHTGAIVGETAKIGNNVQIIGPVVLGSTGKDGFLRHTIVGDRAVLGIRSVCLGRLTIGQDAKVGAGAVVLRDVPPGATVVGVPAKVVRKKDNLY